MAIGDRSEGRPLAAHRLPGGRHGLPAKAVAESQRWRLIGAAAEVLAEHGYLGTTSRRIATAAAVSSSTFYAHFNGVPDCLLASFRVTADSVLAVISRACEGRPSELRKTEPVLNAAVAFCRSESQLTLLLSTELSVALEEIWHERSRLVGQLARLLRTGGDIREATGQSSAPMADPIVAIVALICDRSKQGRLGEAPQLGSQLSRLLLAATSGTARC